MDELNAEVKRAFEEQSPATLGKVWVSFQAILQEIIIGKGNNIFKLPHLKKDNAASSGSPIPKEMPLSPEGSNAVRIALASAGGGASA